MRNIFLIGYMGTGKSTVAAYLQENYGMEVVEMDQEIAEIEGMSISDIFATKGEPYFRDIETKFLVQSIGKENQVVSCGGGVVLRKQNVEVMRKSGQIVLLTAKPETVLERVKDDESRPLLKGNKNVAFIQGMMENRREKYETAADIIIETDGKDAQAICKEIIEKLG